MNVTWHVNNLKVSHKDPFYIFKFSCYLSFIYLKEIKLKKVKVHDNLGMDVDLSDKVSLKVSIIKNVKNIMENFTE